MTSRIGDIKFVIRQNNDEHTIIIEFIEDPSNVLQATIGYQKQDLIGLPLRSIFPERIASNIDDYLEFSDFGNDLTSVLGKTREFALRSHLEEEVVLNMRIQRDVSEDKHARYAMVVQGYSEKNQRIKTLLDVLRENEIVDEITGLCNWEVFLKKVGIINTYLENNNTTATFAVIRVDKFDRFTGLYGDEASGLLLGEVVGKCQQSFREADILGALGSGKFGVALLEANSQNAQIPLNRLRWQIASQPLFLADKGNVTVTLSVAYQEISSNCSVEQCIENCKNILENYEEMSNQLIEA